MRLPAINELPQKIQETRDRAVHLRRFNTISFFAMTKFTYKSLITVGSVNTKRPYKRPILRPSYEGKIIPNANIALIVFKRSKKSNKTLWLGNVNSEA